MTNEAKTILEDIISDFAPEKFIRFFRAKSRQFKELKENLAYYHDDDFAQGQKLGEIKFTGGDALIVCAFAAQNPLTERSGKKAQYDKARKILKDHRDYYAAGIFIFYDAEGNFRFSLVYPEYTEDQKKWPNFRRFTYFASREFTNKTFLKRIGDVDFAELSKIKESFSVEKVTREFYEDIANWYFWAIEHSRFPKDAEAEENGRNISIIRLITRIIFIWFMRERGLVPKSLFEEKTIRNILYDNAAEASTFYKAILQNLFFATLSTRKEARQFRSEVRGHKGYNPDFGNQYVYRYHDLFKNPDDIKTYFGNVPFLNGGLFECLDDKPNGVYIDGFTSVKKNQPEVPNFLFFSGETKADLNAVYGTKNKTYKVMGLLDILRSFNFTIDENSPDDQEVALDPELLGRVFENLLASFNPETSTTARKSTGSYYTPRGIVDYMVSESLKAYFRTNLFSDIHSDGGNASLDEKLDKLFSTENDANPFNGQESEKIVSLIENVKIVDPAVGSGAFPMGALHKMVFILNKVDPGNVLWKQAQIRAAGGITDPAIRRDTIKRIEDFFQGKNADYGRKLYLIQRCIYGVDIQQIAVEIAKLRFFIALLVDEKIEPQKDNWGIEPLPNLDFKIMQGNSLISSFMGVDFDADTDKTCAQTQAGFDFVDTDDGLIKVFEQKKIDFQNEPDAGKKKQFKDEIEELLIRIFEARMKKQKASYFQALEDIERRNAVMPNASRAELIAKEKEKLSRKTGFDLENIEKQLREFTGKKKTRPFFPWRLYFAEVFEKGGFDVVIGNPPWGQKSVKFSDGEIKYFKKTYPAATIGILDIFRLFIERGINLVNPKGSFAYVLPDIFLLKNYETTRKFVLDNLALSRIDHWGMAFDNVNLDSCTIIGSKSLIQNKENAVSCIIHLGKNELHNNIEQSKFFQQEGYKFNLYLTDKLSNLINKLNQENKFGDYFEAHEGIHSGNIRDKLFLNKKINDNCKKLIFGRSEINKYYLSWNGKWVNYDKNIINKSLNEYAGLGKPEYFINHKIVVRRTGDFIMAALDENGFYFSNNVFVCVMKESSNVNMKYTLGILNSKMATWFYRSIQPRKGKLFAELKINVLNTIPIKQTSTLNQNKVIKLVDEIMIKKTNDPKANVDELENEIDKLVFSIFMLSPEEIELINKSFT